MPVSIALPTELEAVNVMLEAIQHGPVDSLDDNLSLDVGNARRILRETSRIVQTIGWWFNRERDLVIAHDPLTGGVKLPLGTMLAIPNDEHRALDIVDRGGDLYSRANHTFNIGQPIKATVIMGLVWENIPVVGRRYIALRAARALKAANEGIDINPSAEESMAWVELRKADLECEPQNMLNAAERNPGVWGPGFRV